MRLQPAVPGETGELDIRLIRLGRREHRGLGDLAPLAASIRDGNLRHPVTISPRYGLITGRRRLAACASLGRDRIPYRAIGTVAEALDAIAEEDADPRQSLPMTVAEVIYRDWQMRDELEWWPRAGSPRKGVRRPATDHRFRLAAAARLNGSQYTRAYAVILAAEGFRRAVNRLHSLEDDAEIAAARDAAKMLQAVNTSVIDTAYRKYRTMLPSAEAAPAATVAEVDAGLAKLTGMVAAFSGIILPPDAAPATLQRWDDTMTAVIRPLAQFRRDKIRRINASQA